MPGRKKKVQEGEFIPKDTPKTKYEPWMCDKIIQVASEGGHVSSMCTELGIKSRDTFYRWLELYPEFKEAYETAQLHSQSFYENLLLAGACGKIKNFNFSSVAMIMNNKFSDEYKRSANGANTEISIGSINSIEALDTKALDDKIKGLTKQLKYMGVETVESEQEE